MTCKQIDCFAQVAQGRNTAGNFVFERGLIYERMRLCKRRASCDNVRWRWYLSIWADLRQPQRHKKLSSNSSFVCGRTHKAVWTRFLDGGRLGEGREESEGSESPSKQKQHSIPIRGGLPRWARMGSAINWSGDGLTASAETAETARWTARASEGVISCTVCCYVRDVRT